MMKHKVLVIAGSLLLNGIGWRGPVYVPQPPPPPRYYPDNPPVYIPGPQPYPPPIYRAPFNGFYSPSCSPHRGDDSPRGDYTPQNP
jgi:hypothetical protein